VDLFDNTSPTRLGRCGFAFLSPEAGGTPQNHFRLALKKIAHRSDPGPVDPTCGCKTCRQYSRGYLRHLFRIEDPLGMRLLSYHNVWFMCHLSRAIHEALLAGTFAALAARWVPAVRS
jgi:tRNA-guanine family transglycosylase